jgi:hypothetical protein
MTTASLPLRLEIKNTGITASNSTLSQICSTVISEGGYELYGSQQAVGTTVTEPVDLPTAGTYYPVVSIRLKSNRLDAIVILTALSISGGGSWVSAGDTSAVEYKLAGGSVDGGRILASGFTGATTQSISPVDILKEALFKFQLERNSFANTAYELTLVASASTNGADMYGSMDWEEVTR